MYTWTTCFNEPNTYYYLVVPLVVGVRGDRGGAGGEVDGCVAPLVALLHVSVRYTVCVLLKIYRKYIINIHKIYKIYVYTKIYSY